MVVAEWSQGIEIAPMRRDRHSTAPTMLTRREREVLLLLCQRYTDPEIATQLYISPRTVNHHVRSILAKLGASNRRQAGAVAAHHGLV